MAAIHELPDPAADLREQAGQLANMVRGQLRPDGAIGADDETSDLENAAQHYSGPALYGIIRSNSQSPAPWKTEALAKARGFVPADPTTIGYVDLAPRRGP